MRSIGFCFALASTSSLRSGLAARRVQVLRNRRSSRPESVFKCSGISVQVPSEQLFKSLRNQRSSASGIRIWVNEHLNVLICGATGVGKSYLACALGQGACRKGLRVLYRRMPRLLDELALARTDGSYARLLAKLAKVEILVLDDWGLGTLKDAQRHDLLEVLEDRYGRASTVVTSQLPASTWRLDRRPHPG